jgi:2'-5' RNA ligase
MNIKKRLKELLVEGEKKYSYNCVMLYLKANKVQWKVLQKEIDDEDVYTEPKDSTYGRIDSDDIHCTILFGIHSDVPDKDVEDIIDTIKQPKIEIKNISSFENSDLYDVLKFDVKSSDLTKFNKEFAKLPHTNEFDYHPHITICYVKKDKASKYIKKLKDKFDLNVVVDKIVYSKSDGTQKDYKINDKTKN